MSSSSHRSAIGMSISASGTHETNWQKSSFSNGIGACVEVAYRVGTVSIRDSKHRRNSGNDLNTEPIITISTQKWTVFLAEIVGSVQENANGALAVKHAADGSTTLRSMSDGTALVYTADEWSAYVAGVNANEFSHEMIPA